MTADLLVIGSGIVGQIAALELARAGVSVTLVDAAQNAGSLHVRMQSRFIRLYPEHAQSVEQALPYYKQAAECWGLLEAGLGTMNLVRNGGLMLAESSGQMAFLEDKSRREEKGTRRGAFGPGRARSNCAMDRPVDHRRGTLPRRGKAQSAAGQQTAGEGVRGPGGDPYH